VVHTLETAWHSGKQDDNVQETDLFVNFESELLKKPTLGEHIAGPFAEDVVTYRQSYG
jgi:hypothetical protein